MAGFTGVVMNSCPDDDRSQCDNSSEMTFVRLLSPRVNDVPTSEYDHAAHCMIYCRTNKAWFGNTIKANIMVMGAVIPPLFTMSNGISGLPNFLANMFIGNAKQQLLYALESCEILSKTEINEAVMKSKIIKKQNV
ncbi:tudor-interacting repair regulator protein isoform X2 [Octopus vulgaris]|uniref:Tudor-interacting repair regulator protein isoform X2 n=1 Tax=Octopus vulgaris TaxID=6645 RepID=A0AA36AHC7_OCTVU|nr:tudor-interacting repair regulator protein isoform X2 [Octopus vulgaris]